MAHVFRAKSFITDASANDESVANTAAELVKDYLEAQDSGGAGADIDEIFSISSCKLSGDRVFTIVILEDQTEGG